MKKVLVAVLVVGFAAVAAGAQSLSGEYIARVQSDKVMRQLEEKAAAKQQAEVQHKRALENVVKTHQALITAGQMDSSLENVIQHMFFRTEELRTALKELTALNPAEGAVAGALVNHKYYVVIEKKSYTIDEIEAKAHQLFPHLQ